MDWNTTVLLGFGLFSGAFAVSLREGIVLKKPVFKKNTVFFLETHLPNLVLVPRNTQRDGQTRSIQVPWDLGNRITTGHTWMSQEVGEKLGSVDYNPKEYPIYI